MKNRVLVIAPHPDDEIIGCGGTILKHIDLGDKVFVFFVTNGEVSEKESIYERKCQERYAEVKRIYASTPIEILLWSEIPAREIESNYMIIRNRLEKVFRKLKPNIVYFPHKKETDFDHRLVHSITKEAYFLSHINKENTFNNVKAELLGYEVWTPINKIYKIINIDFYIEKKKELINMYKSQVQNIAYADGISGLNTYRGEFFGNCKYAEVFSHVSI